MQTNCFKIYTEDSLIVMEWLGSVKTQGYKDAHMSFLQQMQTGNYLLWLLDYKKSGDVSVENHEWVINEWLPKTIELLKMVQKIAVVVPDNIFSKISMRILTTQLLAQRDVDIAFFRNDEEAKNWLVPELSQAS